MKLRFRPLGLLATLLLPLAAPFASAQGFAPSKPVRMLVGYNAGSSTDVIGRIVAQGLSEQWKQPVVLENRGGAAGNIAADAAAKSPGDGYTLLFAQNALAISVAANPALPFNGQRDLIPLMQVTATPHILLVNNASPYRSVQDLVAEARRNPDKLNFGSAGIGNSDHMAGELFKALAGVQATHVPYKSGAMAATDLLGGQIDFYFAGMPVGLPQVKGGRLRALAVTSTEHYPGAPELPTMQESGVAGYQMALWQGVFLPATTPPAIVDAIAASLTRLMADPAMRERITQAGAQMVVLPRAAFADVYNKDIERWKRVFQTQNIKLQ